MRNKKLGTTGSDATMQANSTRTLAQHAAALTTRSVRFIRTRLKALGLKVKFAPKKIDY